MQLDMHLLYAGIRCCLLQVAIDFINLAMVLQAGSMQFGNARESMKSPLAKKLFQVDGVTGVFFGSDFVTVTKSDDYTWNVVKPDIFAGIMDHFTSGTCLRSFLPMNLLAGIDTCSFCTMSPVHLQVTLLSAKQTAQANLTQPSMMMIVKSWR